MIISLPFTTLLYIPSHQGRAQTIASNEEARVLVDDAIQGLKNRDISTALVHLNILKQQLAVLGENSSSVQTVMVLADDATEALKNSRDINRALTHLNLINQVLAPGRSLTQSKAANERLIPVFLGSSFGLIFQPEMQIILQPVLFQTITHITSILEKVLSEEFNASIIAASSITQIPPQLFDKQRKQWKSNDILQWLSNQYKAAKLTTKMLAICDFDAYSDSLNFVFGEAFIDGSISAIYIPRLRQEFYGLKPDESLFYQRIVKEAVHELGHAFSLNHCGNARCVMHFSNSLSDTDFKEEKFCNVCKKALA